MQPHEEVEIALQRDKGKTYFFRESPSLGCILVPNFYANAKSKFAQYNWSNTTVLIGQNCIICSDWSL